MYTMHPVPEVSLISSWCAPGDLEGPRVLYGLDAALREGVLLFDLYFLGREDIPWYREVVRKARTERERKATAESDERRPVSCPVASAETSQGEEVRKDKQFESDEPHSFVESLAKDDLDDIAEELRGLLGTEDFGGPLVGRRPRFAAMASFFPNISLPGADVTQGEAARRRTAVGALRNTLYLARALGCHCVEIVGGACVPVSLANMHEDADSYRTRRLHALARSLSEVYDPAHAKVLGDLPPVAVELEPGPSFLLNSDRAYRDLRDMLAELQKKPDAPEGAPIALSKTLLNLDIAHATLIGLKPKDCYGDLSQYIAHMHISDHGGEKGLGGSHAADLRPTSYHNYSEFRGWLELAVNLHRSESDIFSGVVAVELEACNDLSTVLSSTSLVRRWLRHTVETWDVEAMEGVLPTARTLEGAVLTIDVGNSTAHYFGVHGEGVQASLDLEEMMTELCRTVRKEGGSVMSFTGDGYIAFFEKTKYADAVFIAQCALKAAIKSCKKIQGVGEHVHTARAVLHWGDVYIPTARELRDQILGEPVVCGVRICDLLSHTIEPGFAKWTSPILIGATPEYLKRLVPAPAVAWDQVGIDWGAIRTQGDWTFWHTFEPKGLDKEVRVLLAHNFLSDQAPPPADGLTQG